MTIDFNELAVFKLERWDHNSPKEGLCAMEAVAWLEGQEHTDSPECTCDYIAAYVRVLNDRWGSSARQRLIPYLPRLVGTNYPVLQHARAQVLREEAIKFHKGEEHLDRLSIYARDADILDYATHILCRFPDAALHALDLMLDLNPTPPGFSTNVPKRVEAYKELLSEMEGSER